jgi:hypothetical protein
MYSNNIYIKKEMILASWIHIVTFLHLIYMKKIHIIEI